MLIIEIIYQVKDNQNVVKIFEENFVKKNKKRYKISYKGKLFPLKSEFQVKNKSEKKLIIKLICYNHFDLEIINLIKACGEDFYELRPSNEYKNNLFKFYSLKDRSLYNWSSIVYFNIEKKIRIFGEIFVDNNKDNCVVGMKNRIFPLKEFFLSSDIGEPIVLLELILIEYEIITDRSYMFYSCDSLRGFMTYDDIKEITEEPGVPKTTDEFYFNCKMDDEKNISNLSNNYNLSSTFSPNKTNWNTLHLPFNNSFLDINKSINNMDITERINWLSGVLPFEELSKWNVSEVYDMSYMFYGCSSLCKLPDKSEWETNKVFNMSYMFYGCKDLTSLNDIINWNTSNVINMSYMFFNCNSLKSFPDIKMEYK